MSRHSLTSSAFRSLTFAIFLVAVLRFGGAAGTTNTPDLQTLIQRDHAASSAFDAKDIKPMRGSSDRVMMLGGAFCLPF